ncbi:PIN domain-containing protein, partial [uncultured Campylobacter sp.]|uniref:PIN domain-containing protein n=1 Tax=uncultured Campylobacter sp. TaxID=218934 RepID=UPI00260A6A6B
MARFIIDDENISIDNLATLKKLGQKDKIYIVTNNRQKLSISVLAWFLARKIKIKIILLESAHKDYADKIITFLMGKLSHKKDKIYIVSNDKFYDDVIDFFNKQDKNGGKFHKLKFDFNRSHTAQLIEENRDEIAILIRNSGSLSELHMKFISKFGSKNGAGVYKALKEDARKIYKKPQIENAQKGEVKRIAAPNSAKYRPVTQGDEQKLDEREKSQMVSNLSGETLHTQSTLTKEQNLEVGSQIDQNLENSSQNVQNLEPEKLQSLKSKNGVATNNENLQEAKAVEANLSDDLG